MSRIRQGPGPADHKRALSASGLASAQAVLSEVDDVIALIGEDSL